ncbi:unnamed protein product [Closterium sp. Naga37s-1]|nr:unnamed protein product [Closterium sp. Naga37s-1]
MAVLFLRNAAPARRVRSTASPSVAAIVAVVSAMLLVAITHLPLTVSAGTVTPAAVPPAVVPPTVVPPTVIPPAVVPPTVVPPAVIPPAAVVPPTAPFAQAAPGTLLALYNRQYFANSPKSLPFVAIRPNPAVACYDLPPDFARSAGSARIWWNTKDNQPEHINCGTVWFFPGYGCTGAATGIRRPGSLNTTAPRYNAYSKLPAQMATAASVGCSFFPDPCAIIACADPNAMCKSSKGTSHVCRCQPGFTSINGTCTDVCTQKQCPLNSTCIPRGSLATCRCDPGFDRQEDGTCSPTPANKEWLQPHNDARAEVGSPLLVWNETLAAAALTWAQQLVNSSAACFNTTLESSSSSLPYGQNTLAAVNTSPSEAVQIWTDEAARYSRSPYPFGCNGLQLRNCVHFIRAVWNTTLSVGCAAVPCKNNWQTFVCNYYPKGAIPGAYPY